MNPEPGWSCVTTSGIMPSMLYRLDRDLEFLHDRSVEELDPLVTLLTKDKKGSSRLTEQLTRNPRYRENQPDHPHYWDLIAAELQCFGANTFATILRGGRGVLYREVLLDVWVVVSD